MNSFFSLLSGINGQSSAGSSTGIQTGMPIGTSGMLDFSSIFQALFSKVNNSLQANGANTVNADNSVFTGAVAAQVYQPVQPYQEAGSVQSAGLSISLPEESFGLPLINSIVKDVFNSILNENIDQYQADTGESLVKFPVIGVPINSQFDLSELDLSGEPATIDTNLVRSFVEIPADIMREIQEQRILFINNIQKNIQNGNSQKSIFYFENIPSIADPEADNSGENGSTDQSVSFPVLSYQVTQVPDGDKAILKITATPLDKQAADDNGQMLPVLNNTLQTLTVELLPEKINNIKIRNLIVSTEAERDLKPGSALQQPFVLESPVEINLADNSQTEKQPGSMTVPEQNSYDILLNVLAKLFSDESVDSVDDNNPETADGVQTENPEPDTVDHSAENNQILAQILSAILTGNQSQTVEYSGSFTLPETEQESDVSPDMVLKIPVHSASNDQTPAAVSIPLREIMNALNELNSSSSEDSELLTATNGRTDQKQNIPVLASIPDFPEGTELLLAVSKLHDSVEGEKIFDFSLQIKNNKLVPDDSDSRVASASAEKPLTTGKAANEVAGETNQISTVPVAKQKDSGNPQIDPVKSQKEFFAFTLIPENGELTETKQVTAHADKRVINPEIVQKSDSLIDAIISAVNSSSDSETGQDISSVSSPAEKLIYREMKAYFNSLEGGNITVDVSANESSVQTGKAELLQKLFASQPEDVEVVELSHTPSEQKEVVDVEIDRTNLLKLLSPENRTEKPEMPNILVQNKGSQDVISVKPLPEWNGIPEIRSEKPINIPVEIIPEQNLENTVTPDNNKIVQAEIAIDGEEIATVIPEKVNAQLIQRIDRKSDIDQISEQKDVSIQQDISGKTIRENTGAGENIPPVIALNTGREAIIKAGNSVESQKTDLQADGVSNKSGQINIEHARSIQSSEETSDNKIERSNFNNISDAKMQNKPVFDVSKIQVTPNVKNVTIEDNKSVSIPVDVAVPSADGETELSVPANFVIEKRGDMKISVSKPAGGKQDDLKISFNTASQQAEAAGIEKKTDKKDIIKAEELKIDLAKSKQDKANVSRLHTYHTKTPAAPLKKNVTETSEEFKLDQQQIAVNNEIKKDNAGKEEFNRNGNEQEKHTEKGIEAVKSAENVEKSDFREAMASQKVSKPFTQKFAEELKESFISHAKTALKEGRSEIRMQMEPKDLGKMIVKISVEDFHLIGRVRVESHEAKYAFDNNLPKLQESLANNGINMERFEVFVNQDNRQNMMFAQSEAFAGNKNGGAGGRSNRRQVEPDNVKIENRNRRSFGYNTMEMVV